MGKSIAVKTIQETWESRIQQQCASLRARNIIPRMAVIVSCGTMAAQQYLAAKKKIADQFGIELQIVEYDHQIAQKALMQHIRAMSQDKAIHGIFLELPLPKHMDTEAVCAEIPWEKDVEGIGVCNLGMLLTRSSAVMVQPATAQACVALIESVSDIAGKTVVLIGMGRTVGQPLFAMLLHKAATVICCDKNTSPQDMRDFLKRADMVISAVGVADAVLPDGDILRDKIVIDVGMCVGKDGVMRGDFDASTREQARDYATSSAVGTLTTRVLFLNLLQLIECQENGT